MAPGEINKRFENSKPLAYQRAGSIARGLLTRLGKMKSSTGPTLAENLSHIPHNGNQDVVFPATDQRAITRGEIAAKEVLSRVDAPLVLSRMSALKMAGPVDDLRARACDHPTGRKEKKRSGMATSDSGSFFRKAVTAACLAAVFGLCAPVFVDQASAFDPKKVFKEEKPSAKKLFKFYLKKKKEGDDAEAFDVLQYAADQGNPTAQWKLGKMYESGDSVVRDPGKAFEFYKKIADNYGEARPNTPEWAITGKAMVALGHYYRQGLPDAGIAMDENEARVMYSTAAMYFRDPDGQFELGKMILEGGSSLEEGRQAIRMLQLARKKGHPGALALVGHALVEGEYVLQDVVRGLTLLTEAADRAPADMLPWVQELQQRAFAIASVDERRQAIINVRNQ